jgi:alpha,alpha-trehalase
MTMTGMLHPSLRPLLQAVQQARVYDDSKAAVDLVLRRDPEEVARLAAAAPALKPLLSPGGSNDDHPSPAAARAALAAFLDEHCDPPGSDLEPHTPEDWRPDPPRLSQLGPRPAEAGALETAAAAAGLPLLTDDERAAVHELARTVVHARWKVLCRRWKGSGGDDCDATSAARLRSSLLPLPEPQMVPGDRFREAYYWDSYWVVRGLLASGMARTAAATVRNLVAMAGETTEVESGGNSERRPLPPPGGHVPNGARCYYLNRSQPPLLSMMVRAVAEELLQSAATADAHALLRLALPAVERELEHWQSPPKQVIVVASTGGDGQAAASPDHHYALARYWAQWDAPRPESQREDEQTAQEAPCRHGRRRLMRDLASAAESGWDFSTRWMVPPPAATFFAEAQRFQGGKSATATATQPPSLASLRTTRVVPADLNAFLYRAERDAAWAARTLGQAEKAGQLEARARARRQAMQALLWDDAAACWRDGWLVRRWKQSVGGESEDAAFPAIEDDDEEGEEEEGASATGHDRPWVLHRSPGVFASNYVPLWCGLLDDDADPTPTADRVAASLLSSGLLAPGGVAASLYASGQQWDWPNVWPPLQHALAEGLMRSAGGSLQARALGLGIAAAYARAVLGGWRLAGGLGSGELHEKYDARGGGREGAGGEYAPQVGFGWTNGALLSLLVDGMI